jgi:putative transposase
MSRSRHTEAEMIGALKHVEAGRKAEDLTWEVGVSKHIIYAWKAKYGEMEVSEVQEVKQVREENARLEKLRADLSLDKEPLQSVIRKNGWSSRRRLQVLLRRSGEQVNVKQVSPRVSRGGAEELSQHESHGLWKLCFDVHMAAYIDPSEG